MTKEEQQIAIAEACGWVFQQCVNPTSSYVAWTYKDEWKADGPPDYLRDLNAMHEAEQVLEGDQRGDYWFELGVLCDTAEETCFAAAALKAKAFLKTLKKWKD